VNIDPTTATPCRTVAFSADGSVLAEANYLGFVTLREARTGTALRRFLAQTALVETLRFEDRTGALVLVGAGFEGGRDFGAAKIIDPNTGRRLLELKGHTDDATDTIALSGARRRIVTVGLDRRVIVHEVEDPAASWVWSAYEDYLNTCCERPRHDGQFAVAGDSPYTYILDANTRQVVARIDTPGDCNGLQWSDDGRYVLVADDFGHVLYFDGSTGWTLAAEARVGGAAKRMVTDPRAPSRALVACYDGRVWSISRSPGGPPPHIVVDRRRGMWGINVAATKDRLAVPSYFDRAYLLCRDAEGNVTEDLGPAPGPTYGCNWIAVHPSGDEVAVTHDDGRIRVREAATGRLRRVLGPDSSSLYMGAAFHPSLPVLATIDFHGEMLVYDYDHGTVVWRQDMGFGPGICVDWSPCGRYLAAGGYAWRGRMATVGNDGRPVRVDELEAKARGVWKSIAFASPTRLLVASGDGALVVHDLLADRWVATRAIRGVPPMELSNGVAASPDGRLAYIVSRDQSIRAIDLESGVEVLSGLAHVRGVKTVHASSCGAYVATGAYDRTVMIWSASDLSVRLPPIRLANSGVSGVRCHGGRVFACSFDGVAFAADASNGRVIWSRTAADTASEAPLPGGGARGG
jgi:WD40 repeat protein